MSQLEQVVHSLAYAMHHLKLLCDNNPNLTECGIVVGEASSVLQGATVEGLDSVWVLVHPSYWPLISEDNPPLSIDKPNTALLSMRNVGLKDIVFFHIHGSRPLQYVDVQAYGRRVEILDHTFFITDLFKQCK